ncbi:MAG TPA: VOC family protein [Thermoleophilaceae bacterium]|jgi:catechol 2,3-dioxygenase-like lactoylglutathione lyase family enzyme|nr:VOC family protein [Thermoleophilaceae bacterium]
MERQLIDHIAFGVRDYEASRAFYERALAPLGIKLTAEVDADNRAAAFGLEGRDDFWIDEGRPLGRMHVAFEAASSDEVDAFHAAALEAGARDNGAPGLRPQYHATYYAAYVLDPNGNNIEAVFHGDEVAT